MEVIKFIKEYGLVGLKEQLGIKITDYEQERLLVLNYCQINSPKNHPVVKECRQLILDYDLNVVSRSFDRFFKYVFFSYKFFISSSIIFFGKYFKKNE